MSQTEEQFVQAIMKIADTVMEVTGQQIDRETLVRKLIRAGGHDRREISRSATIGSLIHWMTEDLMELAFDDSPKKVENNTSAQQQALENLKDINQAFQAGREAGIEWAKWAMHHALKPPKIISIGGKPVR